VVVTGDKDIAPDALFHPSIFIPVHHFPLAHPQTFLFSAQLRR
jgi:hypothetical protein